MSCGAAPRFHLMLNWEIGCGYPGSDWLRWNTGLVHPKDPRTVSGLVSGSLGHNITVAPTFNTENSRFCCRCLYSTPKTNHLHSTSQHRQETSNSSIPLRRDRYPYICMGNITIFHHSRSFPLLRSPPLNPSQPLPPPRSS